MPDEPPAAPVVTPDPAAPVAQPVTPAAAPAQPTFAIPPELDSAISHQMALQQQMQAELAELRQAVATRPAQAPAAGTQFADPLEARLAEVQASLKQMNEERVTERNRANDNGIIINATREANMLVEGMIAKDPLASKNKAAADMIRSNVLSQVRAEVGVNPRGHNVQAYHVARWFANWAAVANQIVADSTAAAAPVVSPAVAQAIVNANAPAPIGSGGVAPQGMPAKPQSEDDMWRNKNAQAKAVFARQG